PHARRARRRRLEDHRGASAEPRLPGVRHRSRQALRASRFARVEGRRHPARARPRDRRVLARVSAGHARHPWILARGARESAARHRLRLAVRLRPRRSVGVTPRLRHGRSDGERHHEPAGRAVSRYLAGPAVLSGVGHRLSDRLPDGVRRDGRSRATYARGWQLARADFAGADRPLARRARAGPGGRAQGRAEGVHGRGAGALGDDERHAGRSAASSRAGAAPLRNASALGAPLGAARVQRAGVAGARRVAGAFLWEDCMNKIVGSPEQAVADIPDGATVAIAGFGVAHRFATALICALRHVLEHAIRVDYALLRGYRADRLGNVQFRGGSQNFNPSFAKAARTAIVEVDEIVEPGEIAPELIDLPGIFVSRVVKTTHVVDGKAWRRPARRPADQPRLYDGKPALTREGIARNAARLVKDGTYVNLGFGIPTMLSNYLEGRDVILHAENGVLGYGRMVSEESEIDPDIYNAAGQFVAL